MKEIRGDQRRVLGEVRSVNRKTRTLVGFTLIELLIVVAIIGILAVIAIPRFRDAMTKAMIGRVQGDFDAIKKGMYQYKMDHGEYPDMVSVSGDQGKYMGNCPIILDALTTPIQYLSTSNVLDPFAARGVYRDGFSGNTPHPDIEYYFYFSYESKSAWMNRISAQKFYHSAFSLVCWGPDYLQNGSEWVEVYEYWKMKSQWRRIYDPSNGLRSNGDIITAGGNINFHGYVF
jgi:prepilin-type N-terminal cleavage/methylation domain-containing protein